MTKFWQPGENTVLRGMLDGRPWYIQSAQVVKDSAAETVLLVAPGAECAAPPGYIHEKHGDHGGWKRWEEAMRPGWKLEKYTWHTNRFLIVLEPQKYFSSIYIWNNASGEFKCFYINFQLPYARSLSGFDTFDLELDLVIEPDFHWHWKDLDEYQEGIRLGAIRPEWVQGIENAKPEVFERLEKRLYPLDAHWLDWQPDPAMRAPSLPEGWEK
ncbi:MAG TPA: DUF402 domain-containing protein [Anaerolineales bacterium]